jgi:hypothetical protein
MVKIIPRPVFVLVWNFTLLQKNWEKNIFSQDSLFFEKTLLESNYFGLV